MKAWQVITAIAVTGVVGVIVWAVVAPGEREIDTQSRALIDPSTGQPIHGGKVLNANVQFSQRAEDQHPEVTAFLNTLTDFSLTGKNRPRDPNDTSLHAELGEAPRGNQTNYGFNPGQDTTRANNVRPSKATIAAWLSLGRPSEEHPGDSIVNPGASGHLPGWQE